MRRVKGTVSQCRRFDAGKDAIQFGTRGIGLIVQDIEFVVRTGTTFEHIFIKFHLSVALNSQLQSMRGSDFDIVKITAGNIGRIIFHTRVGEPVGTVASLVVVKKEKK